MTRRKRELSDFDLTSRLGRFRAREAGFDVPKLPPAGYGRKRGRKDANHATIVTGLRKWGITVYDMPQPGDILCARVMAWGDPDAVQWLPLELKTDDGVSTPAQQQQAIPIPIARTLDEALRLLGIDVRAVRGVLDLTGDPPLPPNHPHRGGGL